MNIRGLYSALNKAKVSYRKIELPDSQHLTHDYGGCFGARTVYENVPGIEVDFPNGEKKQWRLKQISKTRHTSYNLTNRHLEGIYNRIVKSYAEQLA